MEGQIPEAVKAKRSKILQELDRENTQRYVMEQVGRQVEILIEEETVVDGVTYQTGHTKEYVKAAVAAERDLTNQIVTATVERPLGERLFLCKL